MSQGAESHDNMVNLQDCLSITSFCWPQISLNIGEQRVHDSTSVQDLLLDRSGGCRGDASNSLEEIQLTIESCVGRVIALIRRHVIVRSFVWNLCFDRQEITDGLNDGFRNITNMCSKMFDKSMEQIPGAGFNSDMRVVNKANELFKDRLDEINLIFKERAVSNDDLHVLQLDCRMCECCNTWN